MRAPRGQRWRTLEADESSEFLSVCLEGALRSTAYKCASKIQLRDRQVRDGVLLWPACEEMTTSLMRCSVTCPPSSACEEREPRSPRSPCERKQTLPDLPDLRVK